MAITQRLGVPRGIRYNGVLQALGFGVDTGMLADAGFDFLLFDTHHSPVETKQLYPTILAIRGGKIAPIVRVSSNRADLICFALDAGARDIVVPMVNTK